MDHLKYYKHFTESVILDQLGTGQPITYTNSKGKKITKPIHRLDYQNNRVYLLDKDGQEFSIGVGEVIA